MGNWCIVYLKGIWFLGPFWGDVLREVLLGEELMVIEDNFNTLAWHSSHSVARVLAEDEQV